MRRLEDELGIPSQVGGGTSRPVSHAGPSGPSLMRVLQQQQAEQRQMQQQPIASMPAPAAALGKPKPGARRK